MSAFTSHLDVGGLKITADIPLLSIADIEYDAIDVAKLTNTTFGTAGDSQDHAGTILRAWRQDGELWARIEFETSLGYVVDQIGRQRSQAAREREASYQMAPGDVVRYRDLEGNDETLYRVITVDVMDGTVMVQANGPAIKVDKNAVVRQ